MGTCRFVENVMLFVIHMHDIDCNNMQGLIKQELLNVVQTKIDEVNVNVWCGAYTIQGWLKLCWVNSQSMDELDKPIYMLSVIFCHLEAFSVGLSL